jgi:hypothetical protein
VSFDDLPVGILPGSVRDDPALPASKPAPTPAPTPMGAMSARAVAAAILSTLASLDRRIRRLVELHEAPPRNFLAAGSVAGGGQAGLQPAVLLAPNPRRRGLSVQNTGAAGNLSLGLGTTAPQAGTGITLAPGASWDGRVSGSLWTGSLSVVGSQAGVTYSWVEVVG